MRLFCRFLSVAFVLFSSTQSAIATTVWQQVASGQASIKGVQMLHPKEYRMQVLDEQGLNGLLQRAGNNMPEAVSLELPLPNGTYRVFKVWRTPILPEGLQQKYMQIQTYTAVAMDDSRISAKLDFTVRGFHAMIFDGPQTYFIDPASTARDAHYLVYAKQDYERKDLPYMTCEVGGEVPGPSGRMQIDGSLPDIALKAYGGTKKTYRLALSCTGEYAQAVDGANPTKAGVLSAMVTTMNRVNGIYERELSVTMELIENNDTLIYLSPSSDPFTANNNGGQLLGQNQNNTNTVINAANYDIGHIFSTGGGGIAFLGCICGNNIKARGVTGSPNPVGDPFDVDYVAHEMGHQFGANHTFNSCSGTESQDNAYEPGGGTTIMAYAGICGQINNVQMNSSDYFHISSLDEISEFITEGWGNAGGSSCGVSEAGISAPDMPNESNTYQIPAMTPFMLTAPEASSDEPGVITYSWEQWNLGNFQQPETDAASFVSGPSFRSYAPVLSTVRVFPVMDSIIANNTSFKGERLSDVNRQLRFRAVARKTEGGWGAFNFTNTATTVTVTNTGTPFAVIYPNVPQDTLARNASETITWMVAETDVAPINCTHVDILLSTDGGYTFPITLATAVPNIGSALVAIPDISSTTARVMVKGSENVFFDISNNDLVIGQKSNSLADLVLDQQMEVYPNPAIDFISVRYEGEGVADLALFTILGQKVWQGHADGQFLRIPVDAYARGVYYLQIIHPLTGGKTTRRISLQ